MATKVVMEALSPTMEEGRLVKWLKKEGDAVKTGDVLAEVETDKAIMELVARGDGIVRKRIGNEGDSSPVGTLLAVIAGSEENIDALLGKGVETSAGAESAETQEEAKSTVDATAQANATAPGSAKPSTGASGDTAVPAANEAVAKTTGDAGATAVPDDAEQSQGEASTPAQEKSSAGSASESSPVIARTTVKAATAASTGQPGSGPTAAGTRAPSGSANAVNGGRPRSSPLARRLASERGVDISQVRGSGPGGRIIKRDVETAASAPDDAAKPAAAAAPRIISHEGDFQDVPLTQIRKTIARRLVESIGPVPTFYLTAEFDATRAAEIRGQLKELGDDYKVSFNDIVIKAVASALFEHPEVNAHWMGDRVRHFNRVHVAMAVAVEEGLITPVIFDTHTKSLGEISGEAKQLAERARQRKLTPEQYTGATFSVSNLGMFGIEHFTAIINPPEAGILAVGAVEEKAVVIDGEILARARMRVTMSCDHRVIDGATGAKFLQTVRRYFENPLLLLL